LLSVVTIGTKSRIGGYDEYASPPLKKDSASGVCSMTSKRVKQSNNISPVVSLHPGQAGNVVRVLCIEPPQRKRTTKKLRAAIKEHHKKKIQNKKEEHHKKEKQNKKKVHQHLPLSNEVNHTSSRHLRRLKRNDNNNNTQKKDRSLKKKAEKVEKAVWDKRRSV
jgi:hypothetical protein